MTKQKKSQTDLNQQLADLTLDLQRTRADFENYRKRVDAEKVAAQQHGETKMITKLLPILDTIERAVVHLPTELAENSWALGVVGIGKQLTKMMEELHLQKVDAFPGVLFDPAFHQAVQVDESEGEQEVVAEELQSGYTLDGRVIRHAMVKVTRR